MGSAVKSYVRPCAILGALVLLGSLLPSTSAEAATSVSRTHTARTYTTEADFAEGTAINVVGNDDRLKLDDRSKAFDFIWVAISSKGTIAKIDTLTGEVLGEYRTAPQGQPVNPSRTTVDNDGNVWATNRDGNSVVKVGMVENGQCEDRNGNGVIDTSTGLGVIGGWSNAGGADTAGGTSTADDECILHYVRVNSSGTRHVSVTAENDVWISGTGGRRFDLIDGQSGEIIRQELSVGYGGYGGLIDGNGVIWSARPLLRWDTANPLTGPNGVNWQGYGHDSYGLCIDPGGNVWNTEYGRNIRKFAPDGTLLGTFVHGGMHAQGCVVDADGDVWVAHALGGSSVGRLRNDGTFVGNVTVGSGPTGVAVDGAGKVWATNHHSRTVSRIDPSLGPVGADGAGPVGEVDLTTSNLGGTLYNYSDMTGSTLSGAPDTGTWTVVYDSGIERAEWGRVDWTAEVAGDGMLAVTAASSPDGVTFTSPVAVSSGGDLSVADSRYLRVSIRFTRSSGGESPIVNDLTIRTAGEPPTADAGGVYSVPEGGSVLLDGSGSTGPDTSLDFAWDLDGDGSFDATGPTVPFSAQGMDGPSSVEVALRVCDSAGRCDTDAATVTVANVAPSVDAGGDREVDRGEVVEMAGTFVDPAWELDAPYAWTWQVPEGPTSGQTGYGSPIERTASFDDEGVYEIQLSVTDKDGGEGVDAFTLKVRNRPPSCGAAAPTVNMIWPPNHRFVDVGVTGITDPEGDPVTITVDGIRQDEPIEWLGDGSFRPDGQGVGHSTARVRAERSGLGNGRFYHVAFTADDGRDATCSGTVRVHVPHDRRHKAIDEGPSYDSTRPPGNERNTSPSRSPSHRYSNSTVTPTHRR